MRLSLSDAEYDAVQAAAAPIHRLQRDAFVKALAAELQRHPVIGPGLVHRVAAEIQKTFSVTAHTETAMTLSRDLGHVRRRAQPLDQARNRRRSERTNPRGS
jgi:hypothetical protein